MEGERVGPYRIQSELGSGGMGTVYDATLERPHAGLQEGDVVALKVVHPHLVTRPGFFRRFLREADVGRRIAHPNVVRTLDIDAAEVRGQAVIFLAMELVEGRTLRQLLVDLRQVPEQLLRELARQVVSGLAAIHEAGIVHRDLKPENVLVTRDDQVRIMDLGVARLVEESISLTTEGQFAGSLLYAAPEQFRRREVGPPADLYALGVLLYELASGSNPFRHNEIGGVIRAHLEERPPRLEERAEDVSPFLAAVVATLLEKEPEHRFPDALTLGHVLETGESSTWWGEHEALQIESRGIAPKIPVRRETALYGRDAELEALRAAWRDAREGRGSTLLIEGEEGIGKTRLVDALVREVGAEAGHVLYGAYVPAGTGAFSDAITSHFGSRRLEDAIAPYLGRTPRLVPGFAAIVRHEREPSGAPTLEGDALHAVMVQLLRGMADERPVLWVVEDLHLAPPESRSIALSMARGLEGHRVLLVLTTRRGASDETMSHLSRLETFRRLTVDRLSPREVVDLLRDAFRSQALAERLGGRIAWKSDGVPFFVFEMLRSLREGRFLEEQPDGSWIETKVVDEIQVPSAVRDLIAARLRDLTRDERAILDVGAAQGFHFDASLIARVLEMKKIPVLRALAEIGRRAGLVRAAGRRTRFDHRQVRDVLYEDLPEELRLEYHAALADACFAREGVTGTGADEVEGDVAFFLAEQHLHGSRPRDGLPYLEQALDHLGRSHRNHELVGLIDRVLGGPDLVSDERRIELHLRRAHALLVTGRAEDERRSLEAARELAEAQADRAHLGRVLARYGGFLVRIGSYAEAGPVLEQGLALARELGDAGIEESVLQDQGVAAYYGARYDEAQACFEAALVIARARDDVYRQAVALGSLGNVLRARGRTEEARQHHERHLALAREIGSAQAEIVSMGNLGNLATYEGLQEAARHRYEEALAIAQATGNRPAEGMLTANIGGVCLSMGRLAESLACYERALTLAREVGHRQGEVNVLLNVARLYQTLGDVDAAHETLAETLRQSREIGARVLEGHALLLRASLVRDAGTLEEAVQAYEEAETFLREIGRERGASVAREALVMLRVRAGDEENGHRRAEALIREAEAAGAWELAAPLSCLLASVGAADVSEARQALSRAEARLGFDEQMRGWLNLWCASGDLADLRSASDLLTFVLEHAPEDRREAVRAGVPLHRDIDEAWKAHGRQASA